MSASGSGDQGVSMLDLLIEDIREDEEARHVVVDTYDANCTYPLGYVKRQTLYICHTCNPPNSDTMGGICVGCSLNCHQGHNLVKIYTKRNFRCDCGNSRFPRNKCRLFDDKEEANVDNRYGHNFNGIYCTCDRPYPDPDQEQQDDMWQCTACEDWYHVVHLDMAKPRVKDYCYRRRELVCARCVEAHPFLKCYSDLPVDSDGVDLGSNEKAQGEGVCRRDEMKGGKGEVKTDAGGCKMGTGEGTNAGGSQMERCYDIKVAEVGSGCQVEGCECEVNSECAGGSQIERFKDKLSSEAGSGCQMERCKGEGNAKDAGGCQMERYKAEVNSKAGSGCQSISMPEGWRQRLCRCANCVSMYHDQGLDFLLDVEDTMAWYIDQGLGRGRESRHNMAMQQLEQLDRFLRAEANQSLNEILVNLQEYLGRFAENGKVVREEDITEFFEGLMNNKRRRLE